MKTLYIVGKVLDYTTNSWEFQGVFEHQHVAEHVCINSNYFVGPTEINQAMPHERCIWPGAYYPKLEARPKVEPVAEPVPTPKPKPIEKLHGRSNPKRKAE